MKLTVIGGGGFRAPLVYQALLRMGSTVQISEIVFHDVSVERLASVAAVVKGMSEESGQSITFRTTTLLEDAIEGATFVFCAIRVGGLPARAVDERVPLNEGVIGQETTGPGGICFALRTLPVMLGIAETVARLAPHAWFINFTNPAGLVTEAVQTVLGDRAVGICDSPTGLSRRVAAVLDRSPNELWFDYIGLNHLGWLREVRDETEDLLPGLLQDADRLRSFEEGRLFGPEWLQILGMIPNEYLFYYYYSRDTLEAMLAARKSRAEHVLEQQAEFYDKSAETPAAALSAWRATKRQRESTYMSEARSAADDSSPRDAPDPSAHEVGGYEGMALGIVEALANDDGRVMILNTRNRSSLPCLDSSAVVEVPCVVRRSGIVPVAVGGVSPHVEALVQTIKDVERTAIAAAVTGSRQLALRALALHPLVPSVSSARRILDAYLEAFPDLREQLR